MITEDFVSYEVAQLLKEKGFEGICDYAYSNKSNYFEIDRSNFDEVYCLRPTHQMAMKWLREVHNIFIVIDRHYFVVDKISHIADGFKYSIEIKIINTVYTYNDYKSFEEAVEAAIKYCLENLL